MNALNTQLDDLRLTADLVPPRRPEIGTRSANCSSGSSRRSSPSPCADWATPATDMRKGVNGLSGIVRSEFQSDPTDGRVVQSVLAALG